MYQVSMEDKSHNGFLRKNLLGKIIKILVNIVKAQSTLLNVC